MTNGDEPLAYYVVKKHDHPEIYKQDRQRIEAKNILHLFNPQYAT